MFNKIIKYKFWISGGIIFALGVIFLGAMLKQSGTGNAKESGNYLLQQAKQSYLDGSYKKAFNLYEKLLLLEPDNEIAILDLAIICDDYLGMDDRATALYGKYLELAPNAQKKPLIESWIKDAANESLGLAKNVETDKIKQMEKELETNKQENGQLKKEIETLSGKLYTIQSDFEKEIKKIQEDNERLAGELAASRVRIGKLTRELSGSETAKRELVQKLEGLVKQQKILKKEPQINTSEHR